ncbi:rab3 GTPase-activating protein non-catalytic subunit [Cucurbita maxima]|uniref:Rab3 GTPase-activating protein non-catalytic subunit n=1 Tax=Cucurbita maxima TaxID=3661 RepID=A0A6J1IJM5_CUCMA|nr:rab3 GTPase-activating protein non-catalytic subunit [Cucurbita maxima]
MGPSSDSISSPLKQRIQGFFFPAMARRPYTTVLGCITCEELDDFGSGKEGWLVDNPNLICALDSHFLALANRSIILILGWAGSDGYKVKIRPSDLSPIKAEYISALEWLVFDEFKVLLVGTSCGYLLIYSSNGDLILKQMIHPGRILKIRVHGSKRDSSHESSFEEVSIAMPGVIARIEASDIQNTLQKWFEESKARFRDPKSDSRDMEDSGNSFEKLAYQVWNVSKYGSCADAAIIGVMPPPLMELQSSERYFCAVTVGKDAVISAFRLSEDKSRSLVGAILSKVVPATFSTIASFSKMIWQSEPKTSKKPDPKGQDFARASPLTCLKDHPRKGEKLTLSPSGTLAAVTDSLGRILLLDTQALVVVRLWKGYRDANCLFMEMLINRDTASSSSNSIEYEPAKNDYCLCLAIHAPRKGIVEIWQMRTGGRLRTIRCATGSKLLQPSSRFGSSIATPYIPLEVLLLNGDSGQISVLNRIL